MTKVNIIFPKPHSKVQETIMNCFLDPDLREIWIACGSKLGKAICLNTLVPTSNGFKRMKNIKVGDILYNEKGEPTRVTFVTDPMFNRECFKITFSDDTEVIADADHEWIVKSYQLRKGEGRSIHKKFTPEKLTTKQILKNLYFNGRPNYTIDSCGIVQYKPQDLKIPPYTLGIWLGDGSRNTSQITNPDLEVIENIRNDGYEIIKNKEKYLWNIRGLITELKTLKLGKEKFIPRKYLRSSEDQRFHLLQGLMDSDGTISKKGDLCFDNTNINLANGVAEILGSLGIKYHMKERIGKLYGKEHKLCYRITFITDLPVFRVQRKLNRIKDVTIKSHRRTIKSIEPVKSVPVKCISVDSPSHLYLITKSFIPTHNTLSASVALSQLAFQDNKYLRWIAPIYSQSVIGMKYMEKMLPKTPHVEKNISKMTLSFPYTSSQIQFCHGQYPESLEGEATHANVLDEVAKMKEQVYNSTKTTTTVTRGKILAISTPRGKNWFYQKCMGAKEEMNWCLKNNKPLSKIFLTAPTSSNPFISSEALEESRRNLPDHLYRQYILAEFTDSGEIFSGYKDLIKGDPLDTHLKKYVHPDSKNHTVVIGADWAKTIDFTVFTAFSIDEKIPRLLGFMRFQNLDYIAAVEYLNAFAKQFKSTEMIFHDKTGIGTVIEDLLDQTTLPFFGVTFTQNSKSKMINDFILSIQNKEMILLNYPEMISELDAYEVTVNELGNMKYSSPQGMHDDIVCSLFLGWAAVKEYSNIGYSEMRKIKEKDFYDV